MSDNVSIQISGNALDLIPKIHDQAGLSADLRKSMAAQNELSIAHIQKDFLSFPRTGPVTMDGCRVWSGRLRQSINASAPRGDTATGIQSAIGSNVIYARILEEGGDTKPHKIVAKNAKALHFNGLFRRSVNHPGSHFEGRHFIQRGIRDRLADYAAAFTRTVLRFWEIQGTEEGA